VIAVTVDNQHFYGITFSHQIGREKQKRKNNDYIFHWFWFNSNNSFRPSIPPISSKSSTTKSAPASSSSLRLFSRAMSSVNLKLPNAFSLNQEDKTKKTDIYILWQELSNPRKQNIFIYTVY
jgi:hypothetical protein